MSRVWIVDDEPSICWALRKAIEAEGHEVSAFPSAELCLQQLQSGASWPEMVFLDVRLPGQSGLELMGTLQELPSRPAVILMTAFGDLKVAVEAVRGRAFEYLTKPFELSEAMHALNRAVASSRQSVTGTEIPQAADLFQEGMLGNSPAMQQVYKQIAVAAQCDAPALITGEPGTGKSIVAAMIHRFSHRSDQPCLFSRPDSRRASESEAELFGSQLVLGAIPEHRVAASSLQPGLLTLAGHGTLILEELTELAGTSQAKLLSAIETERFQPLFSADLESLRARLLFTSSQDIDVAVAEGELLPSLASQLGVLTIPLPSLAERREDIRPLVNAFLARGSGQEVKRISEEAMGDLEGRPWPGNVRELKQTIQRAALSARGFRIERSDLPPIRGDQWHASASELPAQGLEEATRVWLATEWPSSTQFQASSAEGTGFLYDQCLGIVERALISELLKRTHGNRAAVAQHLGLHRTTLRQKMKRYGLDGSAEREASS